MRTLTRLSRAGLLLVLLTGCERGGIPGPVAPVVPKFSESSTTISCEKQVIPDPECNDIMAPAGYEYDVWFDETSAEADVAPDSYEMDSESAPCPRSFVGSTTAVTRDPNTGYRYQFSSYGTWYIRWMESLPYLASGQAIYTWPPKASGWTAFNLDRPGTGAATIWVESGRAVCPGGGRVTFFIFYGVRVQDPFLKQTSTGGGGSGGNCRTEYIVVEINYDDGTGWHILWEGYATVCE